MLTFGRFAALPDLLDDRRQAVFAARETGMAETGHRIGIAGVLHAFHQSDRVDEEGTDDRRVQALVIEHQHRVIQAGLRIHHKAAGAVLFRLLAKVGGDKTQPVHARHIQIAECGDGTAAAIGRQSGHRGALQQEGQQLGLGEDLRYQFAVFEVVACQRRFIFGEAPVDFCHSLVGIVDRLAFAQQRLRHMFEAERREVPGGGFQRLDTVDNQPTGSGGEKVVLFEAVFTPFEQVTTAAQF
ncbi:hypothetical protein D3C81_645330 [compost metagenome]